MIRTTAIAAALVLATASAGSAASAIAPGAAPAARPPAAAPAPVAVPAKPPAVSPAPPGAAPEATALLPGGATSLRESHGDWVVACSVKGSAKICNATQQQSDGQSGQRVLAVQLDAPGGDGTLATFVLPFGLLLDKGVTMQVDDGTATGPLTFKTCLPAGCIVERLLDKDKLDQLRKGAKLTLKAEVADGGNPISLTVSLKGLSQAVDRVASLAR